MDTLTEALVRADVDTEMTALPSENITEQNLDASDEVEDLRNSLREVVHDDSVRPKMQCLMMDPSFSMVTMQGEDSGIAWETTPSRCTTPWASEAGNLSVDLGSPIAIRPTTPGSGPAGKIIFVMDEELISRRKKPKERVSSQKNRQALSESSENISGRPELVGVSQPNVKPEEEGDEEEPEDPLVHKEQQLFRLVSEGSEILNIVVPPKLATVDEEESKELADNLSYLEESPVAKVIEETQDYDLVISTTEAAETTGDQVKPAPKDAMDPPGAPVARPLGKVAAGNEDYFEAYTLIDAQAPGGPAVIAEGQEKQDTEVETDSQETERPVQPEDSTATAKAGDTDKSDTVSLEEITSDLLDDVFFGGAEDNYLKSLDSGDRVARVAPLRLPSKPSGSCLFGSQEDILTPIYLPEGPPKIIDPILLEEPKAMAFLYTDLYEEALGSRQKEEDAESLTSEKSFHSRHSDREARGYLEKYVLIDETPVVEVEPADKGPEDGSRVLYQDLYDFADMLPKCEKSEMPNSEEEITDFFRSSANSSPCGVEPFVRTLEEDETQTTTKSKEKTNKNVSIKVEKVAGVPADPLSISSFEFPSEEPDWGDEHLTAMDEVDELAEQDLLKQDLEAPKPVAPPRKKATSVPKACLDLTPLTPVEAIMQEKEDEAGGKEQREEEKETASPAETADEGDGDAEETTRPSCNVALTENALATVETDSSQTESVKDSNTEPAAAEEKDNKVLEEVEASEPAIIQTVPEEAEVKTPELAEAEVHPEKQEDRSAAAPTEPVKEKGQCIIL